LIENYGAFIQPVYRHAQFIDSQFIDSRFIDSQFIDGRFINTTV
jgi:hypothetical protein